MTVNKIEINHSELGLIEINTSIPKDIKENVGDVLDPNSKYKCFFHAEVQKNEDGTFDIRKLKVITPESVNVGWMENSKGRGNYITVIKNIFAGDDITIYPNGVLSVTYN
jgi:hypothetical protein